MATSVAVPPITVEQFLRFESPRGFRCELINGDIILSPDPKAPHYDICERLHNFLAQVCPEPRFKTVQRINLRLRIADQMPSPDVAVFDYQAWVDAQASGYPETTPFLVAEVISPSNRKRSTAAKVERYIESGVPAVWVIYPKRKVLEVHSKNGVTFYAASDMLSMPAELPPASFAVRQIFAFAEKISRV